MFGKRFIAVVEDNEDMLEQLSHKFGDLLISARTFVEFETELLPQKERVSIWFLDVEIPEMEGGSPNARFGIEVAEILAKECPKTPRYCIAGSKPDRRIAPLYTEYIGKNVPKISSKVTELA